MKVLKAIWHRTAFVKSVFLITVVILMNGCAGGGLTKTETGGQTLPQEVTTEYLLTTAGFKRLPVNDETPKRQALLNSIPAGKLTTYRRNGETYYAYADEGSNFLYIGDDSAYRRYQALAQNRKLCQQVPGQNPVGFWSCMDEFQQKGGGQAGR